MISFMHLFCKKKKKKKHITKKRKEGIDIEQERERKACGPNLYCLIVMQMIIISM
jgi:hypothetical protein